MNTHSSQNQRQHAPLPMLPDAADRYSFFGLLRWLSAQYDQLPEIGTATRPQDERFRLGQKPSMAFAPREIADITQQEDGRLHIRLFGLGLLGPNGPMPLQFTDFVRERAEAYQDNTLADFLDIFHHRMLGQLYRAWAIGQSSAGIDRAAQEHFSTYIDALGKTTLHESPLPQHSRLAAAAHLVREARNPDGLALTLSRFFAAPVEIHEFQARWIDIAPEDCSILGKSGLAATLGEGAFAGEKILDRQHNFRIVIGPVDLAGYLSFMPGGHNLPKLIEWVRAFTGFEYSWEVQIMVAPGAAPPASIGSEWRLGWSTWLGETDPNQPVTGLIFEPETAPQKAAQCA